MFNPNNSCPFPLLESHSSLENNVSWMWQRSAFDITAQNLADGINPCYPNWFLKYGASEGPADANTLKWHQHWSAPTDPSHRVTNVDKCINGKKSLTRQIIIKDRSYRIGMLSTLVFTKKKNIQKRLSQWFLTGFCDFYSRINDHRNGRLEWVLSSAQTCLELPGWERLLQRPLSLYR